MVKVEGIDHVALAERDVARSVAWYQQTLGLERVNQDVWGDFPAMVGIGTTSLALFPIQVKDPKPPPGKDTIAIRHVAFRATRSCFEAAKAHLKNLEIEFEFQDHDIAHSVFFRDPDGHEIEITTYEVQLV